MSIFFEFITHVNKGYLKNLAQQFGFQNIGKISTNFSKNYHDITDKVAEVCLLSANGTEPSFEVTFKFTQF